MRPLACAYSAWLCSADPQTPLLSERGAIDLLKRHDWVIEAAVDAYFSGGGSQSGPPAVDQGKLGKLFDTYKGMRSPSTTRRPPGTLAAPAAALLRALGVLSPRIVTMASHRDAARGDI